MGNLLPGGLPPEFTTADMAELMSQPRWLAQKMAYCLRKMKVISQIGKRGRSVLYAGTG
jgi:predicted HTH transcriptional regulator